MGPMSEGVDYAEGSMHGEWFYDLSLLAAKPT